MIVQYEHFLRDNLQSQSTFVSDLREFNQRRNRVVHGLWTKGYSKTNAQLEPACRAAFIVYGLFIEWLETFDPTVTGVGFEYDEPGEAP